jgi:hypothetical protein
MILFAAVSALLAVATFRRRRAAWWGLIAFQVLGLANILTFRNLDMEKLMREMGYSADQARMSSGLNVIGSPAFLGLMAAAWVAMLVFLLAVRKHFGPNSAAESTSC